MAHPAVKVFAAQGDVEDWVGHELAGTVIGDVAASISWRDHYFPFEIPLAGMEQVLFVKVGTEGENGRMFDEEQGVLLAFLDSCYALLLDFKRLGVVESPKVHNVETRHFVCSLMQGTFEL